MDPACRDVIERLLDYLEAALAPETFAALERHLHDCDPCRAYLRTYDRSRRLVGDVVRDELPEGLKTRLHARLLGVLHADRS
ncbi:MAG: anti-sigma factor family protein [Candidatus Rokuibacteriota bacterium]